MASPSVAILDYGSGNVRSASRALERVGADVTVTAERDAISRADGVVVPGVGAFAACMSGFAAVDGPRQIGYRIAGSRPVLGICVGMQILFDRGDEHGIDTPGLGEWPGEVTALHAEVLPHMGWDTVSPPSDSRMFRGIEGERFYFVHSYAVQKWEFPDDPFGNMSPPMVTWTTYGSPFVSAVEDGALWGTQFHPEKSGDAGLALLRNWLETIS